MSKNTTPVQVTALLSLPLAEEGTLCPPDCAVAQRALPVLCVPELVPAVSAGRQGIN